MSALRAFLRRAPVRLGLWMFLPMLLLGLLGRLLEDRLAGGKTPGHPSGLHAFKWMLLTFFNPSPADDSWMPMTVAFDTLKGARASQLYQAVFFERNIKFQYPPSSLLPLEPFERLGIFRARILNGVGSLVVTLNALVNGWLAYKLFRPAKPDEGLDWRWAVLLSVGAAFTFYPIVQAHTLGQIQTWIDLFFSVACVLWLSGRRALAGAAIGLACALKPQLALFLPWALVWRRWDFALGLVACVTPIGLLSLAVYGLPNHLSYLQVLSFLGKHGESFQFNQSVNGLMNRFLFNGCNICPPWQPTALPDYHPLVYYLSTAATLVFLGLAFVPALRRRGPPGLLDFGVAALCFTIASPVAWYHHYGLMLPLYVVALTSVDTEPDPGKKRLWLGVLAASWLISANYLAPLNLLAGSRLLNPLQSHLFFGAIALLVVLLTHANRGTQSADARLAAASAVPRVRELEGVS